MGMSLEDAKKATVWEMAAIAERWVAAHETETPGSRLSEPEKDEIWDWMKTKNIPLSRAHAKAKANGRGH